MNESLLSLEGLTVRYGRKVACDSVSLSVKRGAVYALLGRQGAGKSSLVRCLLGQQKPSAGRALLYGRDAWSTRADAMVKIGVMPEEPDAPPAMTAHQISSFCSRLYPRWDAETFTERLSRFGVPDSTPFGGLSQGQKMGVMLAAALGHGPELLVLDDPTLGLDAIARRALYEELVGELADKRTTIFLATGDLSGFDGIVTRVGILKDARLVLDEDMEKLKARFRRIRYGNQATETRTEFGNELDAFEAVRVKVRGWGIEAVVSNYEDSNFERFRRQDGVVDAEVSALSLEEIFLAVTGEAIV